jgi:hypothetical protein
MIQLEARIAALQSSLSIVLTSTGVTNIGVATETSSGNITNDGGSSTRLCSLSRTNKPK